MYTTLPKFNRVVFALCMANPNIVLELSCIFEKPMKRKFQRYLVRTEIPSTFHAQVEYISVTKYGIENNGSKHPRNRPFPLQHVDPHSVHQCLGPCQMTARSVHTLLHNNATMSHWLQWDAPNSTPKLSFDDNQPRLIHPSFDRPIPNGIRIQSAILPQYTFRTDRPTQ